MPRPTDRKGSGAAAGPIAVARTAALAGIFAASAALSAAAGATFAAESPVAAVVKVSVADQRRLQIAVAPLTRAEDTQAVGGYAQLLDATAFITLVGDWQSATAAALASGGESRRLALLHQEADTASLKAVQAAEAQAAADRARARVAGAQIVLQWSPQLRASAVALADRLATGKSALARVEFTANLALQSGAPVTLTLPGDAAREFQARVVGPAAGPELLGPGAAFLLELPAAGGLHSGQRLIAAANIGARSGLVLPSAAVIAFGSQLWFYQQRSALEFERRPVPANALPVPQGYLLADDGSERRIVVRGAALLLSAERAAAEPEQD